MTQLKAVGHSPIVIAEQGGLESPLYMPRRILLDPIDINPGRNLFMLTNLYNYTFGRLSSAVIKYRVVILYSVKECAYFQRLIEVWIHAKT